MWNELFVTFNTESLFCELLSDYAQVSERGMIKVLKIRSTTQELLKLHDMPFMVTVTGDIISGEVVLGEHIAKFGGVFEILFGRTQEEQYSHYDFFKSVKGQSKDDKALLAFLNNHLLKNTFCNGSHISVSDLYAYARAAPLLQTLKDEDKWVYCNIIRWADHIQSLSGLKEKIKDLRLKVSLPYDPLFLEAEAKPEKVKKEKVKTKPGMIQETNQIATSTDVNLTKEPSKEAKKPTEGGKAPADKKEKSKQQQQPKGGQKPKEEDDVHPVSKLDIRVGKVISIEVNENSEKLYNEKIDIGNGEIRTIASGLKGKVPIENLRDSMVIVLANLKPRTLCGWVSHGMILCASDEKGNIEPIRPAEGSQPGDQVFIGDYPRQPVPELHPKKNPWDTVGPEMFVTEDKNATYQKTALWKTEKGIITTKSVVNAKIS